MLGLQHYLAMFGATVSIPFILCPRYFLYHSYSAQGTSYNIHTLTKVLHISFILCSRNSHTLHTQYEVLPIPFILGQRYSLCHSYTVQCTPYIIDTLFNVPLLICPKYSLHHPNSVQCHPYHSYSVHGTRISFILCPR